jgi:hypothetical protein
MPAWRPVTAPGALLLLAACASDGTAGPGFEPPANEPGTIALEMRASGTMLDPDGYTVLVDGIDRGTVAVKGTTWLRAVPAGVAEVRLDDVEADCSVTGGNPRTVAVPAGAIVRVPVDVVCTGAPGPAAP